MHDTEKEFLTILQQGGVDLACTLPCDRIKNVIALLQADTGSGLRHLPVTREEEGVGICAGAALAGKNPAMLLQNSGIGNMINALLSLTGFYRLPLALFVSHRGVYKEKIAAQVPMGTRLPGILRGAGIAYSLIEKPDDLNKVKRKLKSVYKSGSIHAFLLSPAIWERTGGCDEPSGNCAPGPCGCISGAYAFRAAAPCPSMKMKPSLTRFGVLEAIAPWLDGRAVICNLGIPSKELFHIKHQQSNFYMLGSMGMATPIGLGVALSSRKEVVVIDGDGSLLMNPGSLATTASCAPENLTILAVDNSVYGSTGSQPTLSGKCVDLELVAKGFGIQNTCKASGKRQLIDAIKKKTKGPRFIHCLALSGNSDVPNIPLHHIENKRQFQEFLLKN